MLLARPIPLRIGGRVARYLATGCAGFIGSHLVDALLDRGDEVVGVDCFTDYYSRERKEANVATATASERFSLIEGDLVELALEPLVADVAAIFHLAAQPGVRGSWGDSFAAYTRDNLLATQRVFESAAKAGLRVVYASSSSVYGDAGSYPTPETEERRPVSPYGVTKLGCEHLAETYSSVFGLDVVSLRYFTVYGPRQRPDMAFARIAASLEQGTPFHVYGSGEQSRDATYVADAVRATLAAMDAAPPGAVYNVGGGAEASLRDVIELCERLSGRRLEVRYDRTAPGDVRRTAADTRRIRSELGWTPLTTLEEGLAAHLGLSRPT